MRTLFGTDGIRGVANKDPLTVEATVKLGRAAAHVFRFKEGRHRIVIGKDTRLSGYMLESALTSGICSMGVDVLLVGPFPTPGIAFLTRSLRADAGVMISASHNSFEDNGIKFFSRDGLKLPDDLESRIESLITSGEIESIRPTAVDIGKAFRIDDAEGRYVEFVKASLPKKMDFQGMTVVVDCANGASYKVSPTVLMELGARVIVIGDEPNGTNINQGCGSLAPERMIEAVRAHGADIGIAHDGDADRAVFADEKGKLVSGDAVIAACALQLSKEKQLAGDTVVTTVMSNMGLEIALAKAGIKTVRTAVGDRYVLERMLQDGYNFGGEQSGHIIFLDHNTTGDGLITALQVLALMNKTGKKLSELASCVIPLPQILVNVRVATRRELESVAPVKAEMDAVAARLGAGGRLLVRYSGTEPLVRVMIEGRDEHEIKAMAEGLAQTIQKHLQ